MISSSMTISSWVRLARLNKNKPMPKVGDIYIENHGQRFIALVVGKKYLGKKSIVVSYINKSGFAGISIFQIELWPYRGIKRKLVGKVFDLNEEYYYGVLQDLFSPYYGCFVRITCKKNKIEINNEIPLAS